MNMTKRELDKDYQNGRAGIVIIAVCVFVMAVTCAVLFGYGWYLGPDMSPALTPTPIPTILVVN